MAEKSVFISKAEYPIFEEVHVNIDWFGGFALSQKKNARLDFIRIFWQLIRRRRFWRFLPRI